MRKNILGAAFLGCALFAAPELSLAAERAIPSLSQPGSGGPQERAGIDPCAGNSLHCFGRDDFSPGSRRTYNGPATDFYDIAPADAYPASVDDRASFCASLYHSYDPRSGTYLGYDRRRHRCP